MYDSVSMQSDLELRLEQALLDYYNMSKDDQKDKVNQVLMMHTNGDPLMAEGLRLTFEALVSSPCERNPCWDFIG